MSLAPSPKDNVGQKAEHMVGSKPKLQRVKIEKNMAQPCFFGFGPLVSLHLWPAMGFPFFGPRISVHFLPSAGEQLPIDLGIHDEYSYIICYFRLHSYFKAANCLIPVPNTNTRLQHLRQHRRQHLLQHRSLAHVHVI